MPTNVYAVRIKCHADELMCMIWCAMSHTFEHTGYQQVHGCMHNALTTKTARPLLPCCWGYSLGLFFKRKHWFHFWIISGSILVLFQELKALLSKRDLGQIYDEHDLCLELQARKGPEFSETDWFALPAGRENGWACFLIWSFQELPGTPSSGSYSTRCPSVHYSAYEPLFTSTFPTHKNHQLVTNDSSSFCLDAGNNRRLKICSSLLKVES